MREVNITSDSAAGWLPSEAEEAQVRAVTERYFAALDGGDDQGAYAMMSEINKADIAYADFSQRNHDFRNKSGGMAKRAILKITWTKDPANAPYPGIYAAIDVSGHFANIDRDCGYVVFYQASENAKFELMRSEDNFIANVDADAIAKARSQASVDAMWAQLSANCPNYKISPVD